MQIRSSSSLFHDPHAQAVSHDAGGIGTAEAGGTFSRKPANLSWLVVLDVIDESLLYPLLPLPLARVASRVRGCTPFILTTTHSHAVSRWRKFGSTRDFRGRDTPDFARGYATTVNGPKRTVERQSRKIIGTSLSQSVLSAHRLCLVFLLQTDNTIKGRQLPQGGNIQKVER
jgi:hypothetical protein